MRVVEGLVDLVGELLVTATWGYAYSTYYWEGGATSFISAGKSCLKLQSKFSLWKSELSKSAKGLELIKTDELPRAWLEPPVD